MRRSHQSEDLLTFVPVAKVPALGSEGKSASCLCAFESAFLGIRGCFAGLMAHVEIAARVHSPLSDGLFRIILVHGVGWHPCAGGPCGENEQSEAAEWIGCLEPEIAPSCNYKGRQSIIEAQAGSSMHLRSSRPLNPVSNG